MIAMVKFGFFGFANATIFADYDEIWHYPTVHFLVLNLAMIWEGVGRRLVEKSKNL